MVDCINNCRCLLCDNKKNCDHYKFIEENTRLNERGKLE